MSMSEAMRQMPASAGRVGAARGEAGREPASDEADGPRRAPGDTGKADAAVLHAALTRENLRRAFKPVRANKGAAGVDGLDINQTAEPLSTAWPAIREQLLALTYRPSAVRRVLIPKPDGGERELGIPTVTDRLIQQALLQVLQPILDPTFSEHSYGFRPGRRAQDAVLAAQAHLQAGRRIVVDVELEKFIDRVNHDILIDRLSKRIADAGVIRLIRAYLGWPTRIDDTRAIGTRIFTVGTGFTGPMVTTPSGMVPATRASGTVAQDAEACSDLAVPAGTLAVRAQLFNSETQDGAATDLDLKIRNAADTVVGASESGTSDELVSLTSLAAGNYKVCVIGYATVGASAGFVLNTWLVGAPSGAQTLRAAGPANAGLGATASVVAAWSVAPGARYLGRIVYSQTVGGAAVGGTNVFVDATSNAAAQLAAAPVFRSKAVR